MALVTEGVMFGDYQIRVTPGSAVDTRLRMASLQADFPGMYGEERMTLSDELIEGRYLGPKQTASGHEVIKAFPAQESMPSPVAQLMVRDVVSGRFGGTLGGVERAAKGRINKYKWRELGQLDVHPFLRDELDPDDPRITVLDAMIYVAVREAAADSRPVAEYPWTGNKPGSDTNWLIDRSSRHGLVVASKKPETVREFSESGYVIGQHWLTTPEDEPGAAHVRGSILDLSETEKHVGFFATVAIAA